VLEKAGYRVLVAGDGNQALGLALEESRSIHLLLTDVVMPEMSGPRLSEHLRSLRPETKILYMSGYPNAGGASLDLQSQPNFIQKPFTKEGLLRQVREVLGGNDTPRPAM
jgi:DNA-binding NtrC family response regulator